MQLCYARIWDVEKISSSGVEESLGDVDLEIRNYKWASVDQVNEVWSEFVSADDSIVLKHKSQNIKISK